MADNFNVDEPLFPFFPKEIEAYNESADTVTNNDDDEIYREIQWDYENNKPLIINGDFVIVEGLEALKTWCYNTLQTERYKHLIYTWNYGIDMEQFAGQSFNSLTKVEIIREIRETLLQNKYVNSVDNFNIISKNKKVFIEFNINTEYGVIEDRKEMKI